MRAVYTLLLIWGLVLISCDRPKVQATANTVINSAGPAEKKILVALQPYGDFDTVLITFAVKEIMEFYGFHILRLPSRSLPSMAWYEPRKRYRADSLLIWLESMKPDSVNYIMGFTNKDISCTKDNIPDWGIFGLGYMPGPSCVISTFRLKRDHPGETQLCERFAKVLLHELGHNCGMDHCPTAGCMMEDAKGTIVTVDTEKKELCTSCRNKLKTFNEQH